MSFGEILIIAKMLNEGRITKEQAREMTDIVIEKEYLNKSDNQIPRRIYSY